MKIMKAELLLQGSHEGHKRQLKIEIRLFQEAANIDS
jgi:hypothetical protein